MPDRTPGEERKKLRLTPVVRPPRASGGLFLLCRGECRRAHLLPSGLGGSRPRRCGCGLDRAPRRRGDEAAQYREHGLDPTVVSPAAKLAHGYEIGVT
jgi:hypothetical protein